jgi:hypothetical protein
MIWKAVLTIAINFFRRIADVLPELFSLEDYCSIDM